MAAASFPELNIVLFNVSSSDANVRAADRQQCMEVILDTVLKENYPNLFVLCQDNINGPKHEILCWKLGQDPSSFRLMSEAGVYHRPDSDAEDYHVSDVDVATLQRVDASMGFEPNNRFTTARLMACVLIPRLGESESKVLLVSWHGPQTCTQIEKAACFGRLIRFSERLRRRDRCQHNPDTCQCCDIAIIGGDFNMPDKDACREMDSLRKSDRVDGAVLGGYTTTEDRRQGGTQECIDFVVYWPKDALQSLEISVVQRDFRRQRGNRPFDHPIVLYRLGETFLDLARQFGNITLYD